METAEHGAVDVLVVGAGPVGLACAIACRRQGLTTRVVDKGTLVNSIVGYPTQMELFSTPELIEIGGHPFATHRYKPTREEAIDYYRGVARCEELDVRLYERVLGVEGERDGFRVMTEKGSHSCRRVVVAVGFFDQANRLGPNGEGLSGEEPPRVTHYYKESYPYFDQQVTVVGGKNSAAKAALDCYRSGAHVTLVHRGESLSDRVKYWLRPDLENRITEGSIRAFFRSSITAIEPGRLHLATPDGPKIIDNDFVLAMTGYRPDFEWLRRLGIELHDDAASTPIYDEVTFESNRPGVYLAGTVCGGLHTGRWFIENGRHHAAQIASHVARGEAPEVDLANRHWKTAE
ncbi:MAG: YpdA family putative bacillithiol disulfide reductase [Thermoanaerobaculia bacterium]|nr:YpdA family putative bacillithiol disulfide reductase [Thermoanaerobaculia bacterium]